MELTMLLENRNTAICALLVASSLVSSCGGGSSAQPPAAYQNGATTLAVPDLTNLTGFLAAPSSGTIVSWSAGISEHTSQPTDSSATVTNGGRYDEP